MFCSYSPKLWTKVNTKHYSFLSCYKVFHRLYSDKAAVCHEVNKPLKLDDVKGGKLKKGEVKIKVRYCALNHRDLHLIEGGVATKHPFIPGYEVSGEVVEAVKGDEEIENPIEVGDKVVALTKSRLGGLSSTCIALEKDVWKYNSLEPKVAAALAIDYGLALVGLFRRAKINKDTTVLVSATSGGLGLAALDVAANVYKSKVIGVCDSEEDADYLRQRGAWSAVRMNLEKLKESVYDVTDKKGVDVVYETVGGNFLKGSTQCVKHEGLLIVADIPHHEDVIKPAQMFNLHTFNFTAISLEHYREQDFPVYRQAVSDAIELCEQSLITPHMSKSVELEHVNEAVKHLKEHKLTGKILVKLPH